jgi:hypothetical protein
VDGDNLSMSERHDFVFCYALVSLKSADPSMLQLAKEQLETLATSAPYFTERRLNLLIAVTAAIATGTPTPVPEEPNSNEEGFLALALKFLKLEPNFFGIGVNLNAAIKHFSEKR